MGLEGHVEFEYQYWKFLLISNYKIDANRKDGFYAGLLQLWIKEKKSIKEGLKLAMQKRLRNVTIAKSNKTTLAHFLETEIWRLLRTINKAVVQPQNELSGARSPIVPYAGDVQVAVNHDFSETFEREKFGVKCFCKGEWNYIC